MQLGMIGLGRMGGNMTRRLMRAKHEVVAYDRSPDAVRELAGEGATPAGSLAEVCAKLTAPRVVWLMVPSGKPVDDTIGALTPALARGDIIIDGGNSNFHDSMRRAESLKNQSIQFIDAGTSGGVWGLANGYCLMIGANDAAFKECQPIFKT
ncbi:MAG: NAD(P)-binding domain-containing protein, partial [Gemmatimonadaceae bacterium]